MKYLLIGVIIIAVSFKLDNGKEKEEKLGDEDLELSEDIKKLILKRLEKVKKGHVLSIKQVLERMRRENETR